VEIERILGLTIDSNKREEQTKRTRCIRILEKFVSRIYAILYNKNDTSKSEYDNRIKKLSTTIDVCDDVEIFSDHLRSLRSLVEKMISFGDGNKDIENIKSELRRDINKAEQQKNSKKYKRETKPRKNHDYS